MASSSASSEAYGSRRARILQNETTDTGGYSTPVFRPSSRWNSSSFSSPTSFSSSSFSNSFNDSPIFSPNSTPPLRSFSSSSSSSSASAGIPFSWEQLPGIPKNDQISTTTRRKNNNSLILLPLPPASTVAGNSSSNPQISRPSSSSTTTESLIRKDPFFAAMVECSKEDYLWKNNSKLTKTVSDRFGLVNMMYTSCKRTCAVSESIVYLPRIRSRAYNMLNRREP